MQLIRIQSILKSFKLHQFKLYEQKTNNTNGLNQLSPVADVAIGTWKIRTIIIKLMNVNKVTSVFTEQQKKNSQMHSNRSIAFQWRLQSN